MCLGCDSQRRRGWVGGSFEMGENLLLAKWGWVHAKEIPVTASVLDQFSLTGRRALVTGGGKGLGKVIAGALAQAGADIVVSARTLSDCEAVAHEIIAATGRRAVPVAADVTVDEDVERLIVEGERAIGP